MDHKTHIRTTSKWTTKIVLYMVPYLEVANNTREPDNFKQYFTVLQALKSYTDYSVTTANL